MTDPLAQATLLREALDAAPDTRTLLPLLEPLLEALRVREGLLPWIVYKDPADRPGFREHFEAGFDEWWAGNPRKVGKRKARAAAYAAARRRNWPGWQAVIAARDAQMETPRWRGGVIPDPATWFNGDRWEDDVTTMTAIGGNGNRHGSSAQAARDPRYRFTCACETCSAPCPRAVSREGELCAGCSTGHDHRWPTWTEMELT